MANLLLSVMGAFAGLERSSISDSQSAYGGPFGIEA
jgi:hypothetical protein